MPSHATTNSTQPPTEVVHKDVRCPHLNKEILGENGNQKPLLVI